MHERLCDPKVQLSLGQRGPRFWNVLLVYGGKNTISTLGFSALTRAELGRLQVPGIEHIETRPRTAAVSLRGATDLDWLAVISAAYNFYEASHRAMFYEPEKRVLREAYLLGDRVEGIKESISYEDILADVLGMSFDFEVALPTDEAL